MTERGWDDRERVRWQSEGEMTARGWDGRERLRWQRKGEMAERGWDDRARVRWQREGEMAERGWDDRERVRWQREGELTERGLRGGVMGELSAVLVTDSKPNSKHTSGGGGSRPDGALPEESSCEDQNQLRLWGGGFLFLSLLIFLLAISKSLSLPSSLLFSSSSLRLGWLTLITPAVVPKWCTLFEIMYLK